MLDRTKSVKERLDGKTKMTYDYYKYLKNLPTLYSIFLT